MGNPFVSGIHKSALKFWEKPTVGTRVDLMDGRDRSSQVQSR